MNLSVVLVGTKYSQNIGACARAMANMGGENLILISAQAPIDVEAYKAAAGAQKILDKVQKFSNWSDYLKFYPHSLRVAFSARQGKERVSESWEMVFKKIPSSTPSLHLVFGPEDNGLSESDLLNCNYLTQLKTFGEFTSLNLSQAVLIALYSAQIDKQNKTLYEEEPVELVNLDESLLKDWLEHTGFQLSSPRSNAFTKLNKYFKKHPLTHKEKDVLEKALRQSLRKAQNLK